MSTPQQSQAVPCRISVNNAEEEQTPTIAEMSLIELHQRALASSARSLPSIPRSRAAPLNRQELLAFLDEALDIIDNGLDD